MDKVTQFLKDNGFIINPENHSFIIEQFISEMNRSLEGTTSSLKMIPSHYSVGYPTPHVPVIVIDAGGTRLRTGLLTVNSQKNVTLKRYQETILPGIGDCVEKDFFFDVIASQIEPLTTESEKIGFCFSYPMKPLADRDGVVMNLTKEIKIKNIMGEKVGANLRKSLLRKNIVIKNIAVLNDTIATLLAGTNFKKIHSFPSTIGLIVGTGTNMAYIENNEAIKKIKFKEGAQIINCESGGFNKFESTAIDSILDSKSENPGLQKLEKTVSGRYLGKLIHLTLKHLSAQKLISNKLSIFTEKVHQINIEDISDWIPKRDKSQNIFSKTLRMTNVSKSDIQILFSIINHMISRSAQLVALGCCAVIIKQNLGVKSQEPVHIIYEGSLIKHFPSYFEKFKNFLESSLEMYGKKHLKLTYIKNSSLIGSGIAALLME